MSNKTQKATTAKRIHKVTIKRIAENVDSHSAECIEINDKRGPYHCECDTIGIRADAEVSLPCNLTMSPKQRKETCSFITQRLASGGLWGIESDSDESYIAEIEQEQLAELRGQLHAIGFSQRAISAAFKEVQRG